MESCSIQVKTSKNAYRKNCHGNEGYQFDVGVSVIEKWSINLWYAFVDLQQQNDLSFKPQVFIVPSKWISDFVKPDFTRKVFFLTKEVANLCLERWDYIKETLQKNQKINTFVKT